MVIPVGRTVKKRIVRRLGCAAGETVVGHQRGAAVMLGHGVGNSVVPGAAGCARAVARLQTAPVVGGAVSPRLALPAAGGTLVDLARGCGPGGGFMQPCVFARRRGRLAGGCGQRRGGGRIAGFRCAILPGTGGTAGVIGRRRFRLPGRVIGALRIRRRRRPPPPQNILQGLLQLGG
jgi:hypothetical protein